MKPIIAFLALALAPALLAQQPTPETVGRLKVAPAAAEKAAPAPAPEPGPEVTLIPEQVPQNQKPPAVAEPKAEPKSKTAESAEDLLERIHFREARIKALRDPQVQAEWEQATKAKTDFAKREALKRYYKTLHGRIVKIDGSVKKVSALRETASLRRLLQNRIDPTEPLDPEERAERFERSE